MAPMTLRPRLAALLACALLAACSDDAGLLDLEEAPGGALLTRYVSLGNSVTAGIQSGGLTDSLQTLAYPALVARQAGVPFNLPLLRDPGCPPPFTTTVLVRPTPRVGGFPGNLCALVNEDSIRLGPIQNVAYPGSFLTGAIDVSVPANPIEANVFKTILLGGRSQVEAMADANPTFVSVWLGNNETLVAAGAGSPAALLPQTNFEVALDSVVRAIQNTEARGAALLAPVNALLTSPAFQPGAWYFLARASGALPKPVGASCAPGTTGGRSLVALQVVLDASVGTIECGESSPYVSSPAEIQAYTTAVDAYKSAVRLRAQENSWIYLDVETRYATDFADPAKNRKCQGLATLPVTATPAQLALAVAQSCPSTSAPFFGSWASFDALHPSSTAHRAFADALIEEINARYGLQIPAIAP